MARVFAEDKVVSYANKGADWAATRDDAEFCGIGLEQSPINIVPLSQEIEFSDMMEINGYGYEDFNVGKDDIEMPSYVTPVSEGEFILNLYDGRK